MDLKRKKAQRSSGIVQPPETNDATGHPSGIGERVIQAMNRLKTWQVALIIAGLGFAVFCNGLNNAFINDDFRQIVNNPVVHSITNIRLFFEGSTFHLGGGVEPLTGTYYRPLMTTVFSLIYTLFGPNPLFFHIFQILLCLGSTMLLYLFLRYSFRPLLSLALSLIFLLHPLNSQVVFAIPSMQDALCFFFGILALWLLLRFSSIRSLFFVALCLLLSLLSKEAGVLFVVMLLVYLFWFDRKRLYPFIGITVLPVAAYLALKIHAVGLFGRSTIAPIDSLSIVSRLLTIPSVILFYISKLIFPWKLASAYYWVQPSFSIRHVLLPLIIDLAVVALLVYVGYMVSKRVSKAQYYTYLFFAVWAGVGLLGYLQIIPLDMTACETWFYFPMVGVLGMIGIALRAFRINIRPSWLLAILVLVICMLGLRTAIRGGDWRDAGTLADHDVLASKEDYVAFANKGILLAQDGNFSEAKPYLEHSIEIQPTFDNYSNLGFLLGHQGDYAGAMAAYRKSLRYLRLVSVYERMGELTLVYGDLGENKTFLRQLLGIIPHDSALWEYLAVLEQRAGNNAGAKVAIEQASAYGYVPESIHDNIMNNHPFTIDLPDFGKSIDVH